MTQSVEPQQVPEHLAVPDDHSWVTVRLPIPPLRTAAAVDPAKTVVMVVDLQNSSVHPDGERYSTPEGLEAVEATAQLLEVARQAGARVMWIKSVRRGDEAEFSVYGHRPYRIDDTWQVEFTEPLAPAPGEPVVKKYQHSCFVGTGLDGYLKAEQILGPEWTFVVTGASFVGCVHQAIMGLSLREYRVLVPMDCVSPRAGDRAMTALHRIGTASFSYNTTPLESWRAIKFDASIPTDPRGIPAEG